METVLLGHMGRDEAVVDRLSGHKLHILGQWANPGLVEKAEASGGGFHVIDSITNVELIADYVQAIEPDMFFTNFDDALAAGVVDGIKRRVADKRMRGLWLPCPDQATAKVEWDKFYLRELIDEIDPSYNPINFMVENPDKARQAIAFFEEQGIQIALKPRNLTGGKGVKVQGKHFDSYQQAYDYAAEVLRANNQSGIEIQEKLEGHEFTLQLFTDGTTLIRPPATYDYPYREDGDKGPGTGGMGTFTMPAGEQLPFINQEDYDEAIRLMERLLVALKARGHDYKGVLYPTFFKTAKGLKIVEINARGGDPELINICDLMEEDVDFGDVLQSIAAGELSKDKVKYKKTASTMLYLVSPDYGYRKSPNIEFEMDPTLAETFGCQVRFAAAEQIGRNLYRTASTSRVVGISSLGETPWEARQKIHDYIKAGFPAPLALAFRNEVADKIYITNLAT